MTKTKSTKRALLMSGLALLMCVSMLIGSTFAWFTDSVTSGRNKIVAGNLDVVLEYKTPDSDDWAEVTSDTVLFGEDSLWEPGHTEVVALRIRNAGTLALKYDLATTVYEEEAGTNKDGDTFLLSDYLQVGYSAIQQDGVVGDILMGMFLESRDNAVSLANSGFGESIDNPNPVIAPGEAHVCALAITMPETVGNEANYKTGTEAPYISFGVTLLATQATIESDSFDNQYDKLATVDSEAELIEAVKAGHANILLGNDIELTSILTIENDTVIDLNGKTITANYDDDGYSDAFRVLANVTIKNGTVEVTGDSGYCFFVGDENTAGKLTIESGNYIATDCTVAQVDQGELIVNGGTFKAAEYDGAHEYTLNCKDTPYKEGKAKITVNGGSFYKFNPADNAAEGVNTNYVTSGFNVDEQIKDNGDVWYAVNVVAVKTVDELVAAMKKGGNIVLADDLTLGIDDMITDAASIPVALAVTDGQHIVLDLNGHDITVTTGASTSALLFVHNSTVDIVGDGDLTLNDAGFIVWAKGNSTVNVNGGNMVGGNGDTSVFYASSNEAYKPESGYATINVYGGSFDSASKNTNDKLNIANVMNHGAGRVVYYGGTFGWDPVSSEFVHVDDKSYITVADGHSVVKNADGTFTVE